MFVATALVPGMWTTAADRYLLLMPSDRGTARDHCCLALASKQRRDRRLALLRAFRNTSVGEPDRPARECRK